MRKGWEIKKLGEVCENLDSKRKPITQKDRIKGNIPYYGATGIVDYVADYIFNEKLVLLGEDGAKWDSGDKCAFIIDGKTWVNNHAHVLRPYRKVVLDEWLVYNLNFQNLLAYVSGMTVPKLNQGRMNDIEIPIPPLPEQKRIVAILDEAFAAMAKAKKNAEKNLQNARQLFESYLQRVFANKREGWEEEKLVALFIIKPPKKEAKEKLKGTDLVTFLPMEDLGILNKNVLGVKERQLKDVEGSYTYFANNDVLLAKITPCFENGKIGIANDLVNGIGFGSSEYIVFRSKEDILSDYLYFFLSRKQFRDEGSKLMTGAVGHRRVSKDWIENYILPFPPINEQKAIVTKLDALSTETKKLEAIYQQKLIALEELKKAILQKAFNGN